MPCRISNKNIIRKNNEICTIISNKTNKLDDFELDFMATHKTRTIDVDICQTYDQKVLDVQKAISCDKCLIWYHILCQDISNRQYEMIKSLKDKIIWLCNDCQTNENKCKQEITNLKKNIEVLTKEINDLKTGMEKQIENSNSEITEITMKNIESKIDKQIEDFKTELLNELVLIRSHIKNDLGKQFEDNVNKNVDSALQKHDENKERQNNLIIFNIAESSNNMAKKREHDDYLTTCEILEYGVKVTNFEINKVICLGKSNPDSNKPRPLLVKLATASQKWNIIKNAKNLKDAANGMNKVGIAPDYSENERIKQKSLLKQLNQKRLLGENDWFIHNGELCKRQNNDLPIRSNNE